MAKGEKKEGAESQAIVGTIRRLNSTHHIKKRSLKNKALAISFNDKDLKDFVGGFHKRKKKRRKEAQQQIRDKERLRRIEKRKQRKQDRAYVQGGRADGSQPESGDVDLDGETEPEVPVAATNTYDTGNLTIMVTTSEISREEEDKQKTHIIPISSGGTEKKHSIPVNKKRQLKATPKRRSGSKPQKKRDIRKGKIKKARGD